MVSTSKMAQFGPIHFRQKLLEPWPLYHTNEDCISSYVLDELKVSTMARLNKLVTTCLAHDIPPNPEWKQE